SSAAGSAPLADIARVEHIVRMQGELLLDGVTVCEATMTPGAAFPVITSKLPPTKTGAAARFVSRPAKGLLSYLAPTV
ncbi:Hypothetical predicted protein, partial [Olea europaea subsp. europaea]